MAARNQTLVVKGYKEFLRACVRADADTRKFVRSAFRQVGELVRRDAAERLTKYSERSAHGLKVRVRQRGVAVEQSLAKVTGKRPDYGSLQMRKALLPALEEQQERVDEQMADALGMVAERFSH